MLPYGETLFHCGIGILAIAAVLAVIGIAVYCVSGKRLHRRLEQEYGKKR